MSKPVLAACAAALVGLSAGPAPAQSSVTISGYLDIGIWRDTARTWQVGPIQRSFITLSGVEALGGGLAATFSLSHRFDPSTGDAEGGNKPFFHGESTVGMKGRWGSVQFGRRLDAMYKNDWEYDPWANFDRIASPAWDLWHLNFPSDPRGNGGTPEFGRLNNGIFYDSPNLPGCPCTRAGRSRRSRVTGTGRGWELSDMPGVRSPPWRRMARTAMATPTPFWA
jgi:predicted porin